jgi:hypothetical protein
MRVGRGNLLVSVTAFKVRLALVIGPGIAAAAGVFCFLPPQPQPESYHCFADSRTIFDIPNFWNVASNIPYVVVGAWGLCLLFRHWRSEAGSFLWHAERWPYVCLFTGVLLTGFGSAYYHWEPSTARLVWDRLPMAIAFMSLFAAVIAERIQPQVGVGLLLPLLALGIGSVWYWHVSEQRGQGDLRLYGLVQFYPLAAIPLLLLLFPARYTRTGDLWASLGWYVIAKVCEELDGTIYRALGEIVSGHTLKHLAAAAGAWMIVRMVKKRQPLTRD